MALMQQLGVARASSELVIEIRSQFAMERDQDLILSTSELFAKWSVHA